ncbi:RluA family pseudouridine synthase [Paratissierella segnis]|jgi:23S rRNA pseudouridine1911/1915/1917 synthase|uniref:Pseudouridine synthase n=1 Tax=Paratissierella segnis TaxID=2763679 RepID=A0A926EYJ3_9FIRM|nr:RluA family pseudouridine synthase [Paratissierella segnis]MBC8588754.1 RluA family pseudouridine synthase [Paratissierella segnis]
MNLFVENEDVIVFKSSTDDLNLEEFLSAKDISGRLFRRLYKDKKLYVNGKFQRKNIILSKDDIISLYMGDEEEDIIPEAMDLDIVYEDFSLFILNKGPNIVVHPTKSHQSNTLSNGISYYFLKNGIKKKIRFVNRLDMDTSGLLVVAKNSFAHQQMALQFENNTVEKKYLAVVKGVMEDDYGTIDLPIGREGEKSIRKAVTEDGQNALTTYKVVERFREATLVEVQIYTGRSHQIRVHLNHIGHPIIGDVLYDEPSSYIRRQALHSYYLKVLHPRTKEIMEFKAELPEDMMNLINLMK